MRTRLARTTAIAALATLTACWHEHATLDSITVTPNAPSLAQRAAQQLTATGNYSDGSTRDLTFRVTWVSSDTSVATMVDAGVVLANPVTGGTTVVTATLGEKVGSADVTVEGARLTALNVSPNGISLPPAAQARLAATGVYDDASEADLTDAVSWATGDTSVATSTGSVIVGVAAGDTSVSASYGSVTGSAPVNVGSAALTSILIGPDNAPTVAPGKVEAFTAIGTFDDASLWEVTEAATWTSSDTAVATLSSDAGKRGQATAVAAGSAVVTAAYGDVSATQTLAVTAGATDYTISRIELAPTDVSDGTVLLDDDDAVLPLPLVDGLSFTFYGTSYTTDQLYVSTNANVGFGGGTASTRYYSPGTGGSLLIPSADGLNGFVAPFWCDLVDVVTWKVVGGAPDRQLVIDWNGVTYSSGVPAHIQLVLTEGTNTIDFHYLTVPYDGSSYWVRVGIESPDGTVGTEYSSAPERVIPGLALRFSP